MAEGAGDGAAAVGLGRRYNPEKRHVEKLRDYINSITVCEANDDNLPLKSAIPQQILENPYYALILESAGGGG